MSLSLLRAIAILTLCFLLSTCGTKERYFPSGTWGEPLGTWTREQQSKFYEDWFGGQLFAMKEKPLMAYSRSNSSDLTLRLLFLPTFTNGKMIRLSLNVGEENSLTFKRLSGLGGYEPGILSSKTSGIVGQTDGDKITALIEAIDPWGSATPTIVKEPEVICTDGTQTVLEFSTTGAYKVVSRHNCEMTADDSIRRLILVLDDLSGGQLITPGSFEPISNKW